jgi:3-oxoadipate enol-lactonase
VPPLGHVTLGEGPQPVLVLHDWMGDHHNYDPTLPHLDRGAYTYAFADLAGYGLSRDHGAAAQAPLRLTTAADDVLALADHLGWPRFHLIGHSMSSLIAQEVAAVAPARVSALVLITPVAPAGMGAPDDVIDFLEGVAMDEAMRREVLAQQWGDRLSPRWLDLKLARWAASARPEASRGYVRMFAASATSAPPPDVPVLAVVGPHDSEPFQESAVRRGLAGYPRLTLHVCASAGHYPMQETPVELASAIERFFAGVA